MYSEIVILAMLHQGPRHGYEIKKDVERALGGMVPLTTRRSTSRSNALKRWAL